MPLNPSYYPVIDIKKERNFKINKYRLRLKEISYLGRMIYKYGDKSDTNKVQTGSILMLK